MINIPIVCLTNDKHLWLLRPFLFQFCKYWSEEQPLTVAGYNKPYWWDNDDDTTKFVSIDDTNYPANRWSDGLIEYLSFIRDDYFILFLEDYWLNWKTDLSAVRDLVELMRITDNCLRIDLSADRQHNAPNRVCMRYREMDIIETFYDAPYQMSFQVGIWDRRLMLDVLRRGENPWQAEINGTKRLREMGSGGPRVLGTRLQPVKYVPVYRSHRPGQLNNLEKFEVEDRGLLQKMIEVEKVLPK